MEPVLATPGQVPDIFHLLLIVLAFGAVFAFAQHVLGNTSRDRMRRDLQSQIEAGFWQMQEFNQNVTTRVLNHHGSNQEIHRKHVDRVGELNFNRGMREIYQTTDQGSDPLTEIAQPKQG